MYAPRSFSEVLSAYNIAYTPGDIRFVSTGLKIGSDRDDAIRMLIEKWRLLEPQLKKLFRDIMVADSLSDELDGSLNEIIIESFEPSASAELVLDALDLKHSNTIIRDAQAGALMVTLNNILGGFYRNLKPGRTVWKSAGHLISGHSVGAIIDAGANSFRHYDEWRHDLNKRGRFSAQQLTSIDVIADVLHLERLVAARNASFQLLIALSRRDWDILAGRVLRYTQAVADYKN
jgi:hypothetical protein